MDATTLAAALQASPLTVGWSAESLKLLAAAARWKVCPAGTVLFREGEQNDDFYLVHRGQVNLEMCRPARGCTRLLTLGSGEIVAWSAIVGDGCMTATATTASDVELIEFSGEELRRQCEARPEFGFYLMRRLAAALAQRLLATRLQLLDLFSLEAASGGSESR